MLNTAGLTRTTLGAPTDSMFDLTGKVALITGGSRGIGAATAKALASQGARVVIGYASNEHAATKVADAVATRGGEASTLQLDVSNAGSTERLIGETAKRFGRLDILVASAGIAIDGLLLRLKEEDLDRILAVNVRGAIFAAKGAVKAMLRNKHGRIIFLSSVVGEMGNAGQTAYSASKAALLGAARSIAREYASRGITVNAVAPGFIDTDMTLQLTEDQRRDMLTSVPLGRTGTPEEIAAAVTYLASNEAGYVTGQTLRINGGMHV